MTGDTETLDQRELVGLYDWLSRFNLLNNLLRFGRLGADLTLHSSLRVPEELSAEYAGAKAPLYINDRALEVAGLVERPRVLDAGCGFGGTVFRWQEQAGGTYDGLTLSRVQLRVARRAARRRGLESSCRFHLRSYDDPIVEAVDAVVAIESLIHSSQFEHTVENLASALAPGGKLVLVDDIPRQQAAGDSDLEILQRHWRLHAVPSGPIVEAVLARNNLRLIHDEDLSEQIQTRPTAELQRLEGRYSRTHARIPLAGPRFILEAFLGGLALERLYRKGLMRYRLLVAQRDIALPDSAQRDGR